MLPISMYCPDIRLEGLKKTTSTSIRIVRLLIEIRTKYFSNATKALVAEPACSVSAIKQRLFILTDLLCNGDVHILCGTN
jgi:hypothetical protein